VDAEAVQHGSGCVGKVSLRAFKCCITRAKRSGECVATKGNVEMEEENGTVNSETTSALGGTREVLNEADDPEELINKVCGHRGQVYLEVEGKQAGCRCKIRDQHVVGQ